MNPYPQSRMTKLGVLFSHTGCGTFRLAGFLIVLVASLSAGPPPATLTLAISVASAPPGGTTQVQIFASTPQLITDGGFSIDFDASVFGAVANAAVFSSASSWLGPFT
jgi:hypothetical protein